MKNKKNTVKTSNLKRYEMILEYFWTHMWNHGKDDKLKL